MEGDTSIPAALSSLSTKPASQLDREIHFARVRAVPGFQYPPSTVVERHRDNPQASPTVVGWHHENPRASPTVVGWHHENPRASPTVVGRHRENPRASPTVVGRHRENLQASPTVVGWRRENRQASPPRATPGSNFQQPASSAPPIGRNSMTRSPPLSSAATSRNPAMSRPPSPPRHPPPARLPKPSTASP